MSHLLPHPISYLYILFQVLNMKLDEEVDETFKEIMKRGEIKQISCSLYIEKPKKEKGKEEKKMEEEEKGIDIDIDIDME